jgi:general secretion pathway protein N
MRTRTYIFIGIIAYLVFLVATIPAAPVIGLVKKNIPATIGNVYGTLWQGYASSVQTANGIRLDNIHWTFLPSRLLLGKAAINIDAELLNNDITTVVAAGITGKITAKDLQLNLAAEEVASLISLPIGELSGDFNIMINHASWSKGSVPVVDGRIDWREATLTIAEMVDLGRVSVLIKEEDASPLSAILNNTDGDLRLSGTLTTTPTGDYDLQLSMKPLASASSNIANSLAMFARRQPDASYKFSNKGNLKQLGLF